MSHFIGSDWLTYEEIKDRIEKMPQHNHRGDEIMNPFSYIVKSLLKRIAWILPEPDLNGTEIITIKISFEGESAWVRAVAEVTNE